MRLVIGLQADKHGGFGGTIQLLEVHTNRAVKTKQIRPDGLASGIGHAHPAKTQVVAQRAVHQQIAQGIQGAVHQGHLPTAAQHRPHALGQSHTRMEQAALDRRGVLHTDHHAGEQAFKHTRRRKVIGRADLFQVDGGSGRRLWAVHYVAAGQPLCVTEDVLADPGHWHVGQHFLVFGQAVKSGTGAGAVEQGVVAVHHAFGVAGGAGGEKHGCRVVRLDLGDGVGKKRRMRCRISFARFLQSVHRQQAGLVVIAQAARIVEINMCQLRRAFAHFQELVDLLLVFGKGKAHLRIVNREFAFGSHCVLVKRYRDRAQRLHR